MPGVIRTIAPLLSHAFPRFPFAAVLFWLPLPANSSRQTHPQRLIRRGRDTSTGNVSYLGFAPFWSLLVAVSRELVAR